VIELISGQVVRDERQGGYLTQAVPVQRESDLYDAGTDIQAEVKR
jgi:cell division transport system ATP-binding protein